jgi:glycosyltransferase involved in cell wall biosynthesis
MEESKTDLFFITYESDEASYFASLQMPLLEVIAESGIHIHVMRLVSKNEKFRFPLKSVEIRGKIDIQNFLLYRTGRALSLLCCCVSMIKKLRKSKRSDRTVVLFRSTLPSLIFRVLKAVRTSWFDFVIYDSDGLAVDEELEFRNSGKVGLKYILGRYLEFYAVVHSDVILVRSGETTSTLKARSNFRAERKYVELNNGRDIDMFTILPAEKRLQSRLELGVGVDDFIVVYLGSIGRQYLLDSMLDLFAAIEKAVDGAKLVCLSPTSSHAEIRCAAKRKGIDDRKLVVQFVNAMTVGDYLNIADVGLSLRAHSEAMRHVKPLKTREYLLCGVPVIYSAGTGDLDALPSKLAKRFDDESEDSKDDAVSWVVTNVIPNREQLRVAAREYAVKNFDVRGDATMIIDAIEAPNL